MIRWRNLPIALGAVLAAVWVVLTMAYGWGWWAWWYTGE